MGSSRIAVVFALLASCSPSEARREGAHARIAVTVEQVEPSRLRPAHLAFKSCGASADFSECGFGSVAAVTADSTTLYVSVRRELLALRHDSIISVAKGGRGPGELTAPVAIGTAAGDGVVAFDLARQRSIQFTPSGSFVESFAAPPQSFSEIRILGGSLFALVRPASRKIGDPVTSSVVRYVASTASWSDTLATADDLATSAHGDPGNLPPLPWDRRVLWAVCPDESVLMAASDSWAIDRFVAGRRVARFIAKDLPRRRMTKAEHERLSAEEIQAAPKVPQFREVLARRLSNKPDYEPVADDLYCTSAATAILRRHTSGQGALSVLDVVDSSGALIESLTLPSEIELRGGSDVDRLVGLVRSPSGDRVVLVSLAKRGTS